jgi:hypothetical protein
MSSQHAVVGRAGVALRALGAVVFGIVLAAVAEFVFFVGHAAWLNLVVWAVIGLGLGALSKHWSTAIWVDAVVGFAIVFSYSMMGYQGSAPLISALAPFALIALVGAAGMGVAGAAGFGLRRLLSHGGGKAGHTRS